MLQLFVATTCIWSVKLFTGTNPVYSHAYYVTIILALVEVVSKVIKIKVIFINLLTAVMIFS
jgi:hypothetical protein